MRMSHPNRMKHLSEAPENVHLIGGEMLLWSDTADSSRTSGGTEWRGVAHELVGRLLPAQARVLIAGPHPRGLIDEVAAAASAVTVVLRSYPDACALAERHPELTVHCGRLGALPAEAPYDLVLALDGLGRTHSAEEDAPLWRHSLAALAALVAPGGRFVLSVRNDLGIDRFVEARPADRQGGDAHWEPHGFDRSYPAGRAALEAELESAGLTAEICYAAYPGGDAPRALLSLDRLGGDLPDALTATLGARGGDRMPMADPLRLSRLVFRHGVAEQLAPLWVAVAARSQGDPDEVRLPDGLVEEGRAVHELTRWSTRQLPDGIERPIPAGRVVEEMLVEACAREDVRAVRVLLDGLADWIELGGDAATDNLVWDGERFVAIHPPPVLPDPPLPRVVLCRVLWRFAVRLLAAGHHHPWPWPRQPEQLTLTLCGMAGRPCDEADLIQARKYDAELGQPAELADAAPTYRDLLGARDRLSDQLTAALARISRLETKLTYRERELLRARGRLRRSQRKAAAFRRSLGYRLSRRLSRPRKVARKVMRMLSG